MIRYNITVRKAIGGVIDSYFQSRCRIGKFPNVLTSVLWSTRSTLNPQWPLAGQMNLKRFLFANSIKNQTNLIRNKIPNLELLIVCRIQDSSLLRDCINYAVENSSNQVTAVTIIVPNNEVDFFRQLVANSEFKIVIFVEDEDRFIPIQIRNLVLQNRPDKFGWILQQVLVCNFLLTTRARNVLVVDADTLILRKQIWVDKDERQLLMPSLEFHEPYYSFLRSQSNFFGSLNKSFISHHMLFQTHFFREMFSLWNGRIEEALQAAFAASSKLESSPFDLKYEPYAQFMVHKHFENVQLAKWGNIGLKRSTFEDESTRKDFLSKLARSYNSVSFHHWAK